MRVMICGRRGRGKDFLANLLCELVPGMERHAFADLLKDQTAELLDYARMTFDIPYPRITRAYLDSHREQFGPLWQWYGTEFARAADAEYWVDKFDSYYGHMPHLVVPDMRFENEAQWGRDNGFMLVRVTGPNRRPDADKRDDNHASERFIESLRVDVEFDNCGPKDEMRRFAQQLAGGH